MSQVIQVGRLGRLGMGMMVLAACASVAGADQRGTLEIARGIRLAPPAGWQERDHTRNSVELVKVASSDAGAVLARTLITTEPRTSAAEAVQRLGDIAAEAPQPPPQLTTIGGWPAIERKTTAILPRTGEAGDQRAPAPGSPPSVVTSTVAIAAGATIVRFDTTLAPGADPRILDEILGRVRQLDLAPRGDPQQAQRALEDVRKAIRKAPRDSAAPAARPGGAARRVGTA
jgi:hypothetical protein